MPEASNWVLVRSFLPVEKPKMTIVYENEILINIDWQKNFIYHFISQRFVEHWSISTGVKTVLLAAEATVDRFAHRSNPVGPRSLLFHLYGPNLI
jgi:hypothetical protein